MGLLSLCSSLPSPTLSPFSSYQPVNGQHGAAILGGGRRIKITNVARKSYHGAGSRWFARESPLLKLKDVAIVCASQSDADVNLRVNYDSDAKLQVSSKGSTGVCDIKFGGVEPFRGKSGSISFYGITHQAIEESKLVSSPFKDEYGGTLLWVLAPAVLILSFALPQLFISNVVEGVFRDALLAETAAALTSEAVFYAGVAFFLLIADWVQRPYLQFSEKRWGLITGLKGLLTASFFIMGFKVIVPLAVTYAVWPILGVQALLVIAPLLFGYLAQLALERFVDKQGSSCWPIVPIIFEVYRLYQLARGVNLVDKLMFAMRGAEATTQIMERSGALTAMVVTFQAVALVCVWSLLTFLLRLFPSRPVREKY